MAGKIDYECVGGPLDGKKFQIDEGVKLTILKAKFRDRDQLYTTNCMYEVKEDRLRFVAMKSNDELCNLWLILHQFLG